MPGHLTVGYMTLDHVILVRIQARQPSNFFIEGPRHIEIAKEVISLYSFSFGICYYKEGIVWMCGFSLVCPSKHLVLALMI